MISLLHYETPPGPCGYLSGQTWRFEHELVATMSPTEYEERLRQGWRRFGHLLFRPRCPSCTACRSLRVDVARFRPDRSMRRIRKANQSDIHRVIRTPRVNPAQLDLYDRYHRFQTGKKGWPEHPAEDAQNYVQSFVD